MRNLLKLAYLAFLFGPRLASAQVADGTDFATTGHVGQLDTNLYRTSVHQLLSPVGKQVELRDRSP